MLQTLSWTGSALRLLDQTRLPLHTEYVDLTTERQVWDAIKRLVVRGAPAIGVAAAFGAYLGICHTYEHDGGADASAATRRRLDEVCAYLATARPTAVNLFWALDRIRRVGQHAPAGEVRQTVLAECVAMMDEDRRACRAIGENGLRWLDSLPRQASDHSDTHAPLRILTHCNAGALATVAYGTALAPIYLGLEQGRRFEVFADETRPLLQGSRITAFELLHGGVPVTVLCDNMAASLMSTRRIDAVIVGADRIAANGDTANKIGTLGLAIIAKHFGVPFAVAAPLSTLDLHCPSGCEIPIEQRDAEEVAFVAGTRVLPDGVGVYNPAFDVTPAELIATVITNVGNALPPFEQSLGVFGSR